MGWRVTQLAAYTVFTQRQRQPHQNASILAGAGCQKYDQCWLAMGVRELGRNRRCWIMWPIGREFDWQSPWGFTLG